MPRPSLARTIDDALQGGLNEALLRACYRFVRPIADTYFRGEVAGLEHIPEGACMIVGHHDGGYIPADALCLGAAWHKKFDFRRPLFVLMHDFPFRITPKMSEGLVGLGCLPASKKNADRVFEHGHTLFVYPGGAREAFRSFMRRKEIDLGNRTGFVARAIEHRVPIVPLVSVGAHETLLVLAPGTWLARRLKWARAVRSDVVPLWLGMPWGIGFGPIPHLPLPSKIKVRLLPPIDLYKEVGADYKDPEVLRAGLDLVRQRMQEQHTLLYSERKWPVFG